MENTTQLHPSIVGRKKSVHPTIVDRHGRTFHYLRLAVNEYCNLRCIYCMPAEGIPFRQKSQLLSKDEIKGLISVASSLGVTKIRFTGGEPLMKRTQKAVVEIMSALRMKANAPTNITFETNGTQPITTEFIEFFNNRGMFPGDIFW